MKVKLSDDDLELLISACSGYEGHESFEELGRRLEKIQTEARIKALAKAKKRKD